MASLLAAIDTMEDGDDKVRHAENDGSDDEALVKIGEHDKLLLNVL